MGNLIPSRITLGIMAFLMFFVTQMIRSNLYIAIVAMVDYKNNVTTNDSIHDSQKLNWDQNYIGILLGSFYWCYWVTELPGGILSQQYGGCIILQISVLIAGLSNFLIPTAAKFHPMFASFVRALQGLALGVTWPAMHSLSAKWIPKTERSKFMTTYHGAATGAAITYPISGYLIANYGWECIFYLVGTLAIIWSLFWWKLINESPDQHPTISSKEKEYLRQALCETISTHNRKKLKTPWRAIMSSKPFWAVLIASQGVIWCTVTMSMQLPTYFHQIHNLDIKTNGLLLGIPEFFRFFFGIGFSTVIDHLLKTGKLTLTTLRKISIATSEIGPSILMLVLNFWGANNLTIAIITVTLIVSFGGASSSGNLANIVDIAPNFAGVTLGLIKTLCVLPGVISPIIVSAIVSKDHPSASQWNWIFIISLIIQTGTCIVYLIFGSGEVQSWNELPQKCIEENARELQTLVELDTNVETNKQESEENQEK